MKYVKFLASLIANAIIALFITVAFADEVVVKFTVPNAGVQLQAMKQYWTPERMKEAIPAPMPHAIIFDSIPESTAQSSITGEALLVSGHPPGGGPYTPKLHLITQENLKQENLKMSADQLQDYGSAPVDPLNGPYGPFQRFSMHGKYNQWPRYIHGKLFGTDSGGLEYVCSATVIGRSTIATAGHCFSDGAGSFSTDLIFCPAWYQGGILPGTGCWLVVAGVISSGFHASGDVDQDFGCLVTSVTGTEVADKLGNVTGWAGYAANWSSEQPTMTFGYPSAPPFSGNVIQQTASVEWYTLDRTLGGPLSKYIGSDLGPGSSGGGWFLSWRHPATEFSDTDGSSNTDPATGTVGPFLNGVNSSSRCLVSCTIPPTNSNGVFWQEMSSPQFLDTPEEDGDVIEVFSECFSNPNNDL